MIHSSVQVLVYFTRETNAKLMKCFLRLQENHARMMLKMNVTELQPLIVEIFDLSSGSNTAGAEASPEGP